MRSAHEDRERRRDGTVGMSRESEHSNSENPEFDPLGVELLPYPNLSKSYKLLGRRQTNAVDDEDDTRSTVL
jgi:hypothetical protein